MHPHSLTSFKSSIAEMGERANRIYAHLSANRHAFTDREIASALGFPDMNSVSPRITELIAQGYLHESGETKCVVTGKTVRLVKLTPPQELLAI